MTLYQIACCDVTQYHMIRYYMTCYDMTQFDMTVILRYIIILHDMTDYQYIALILALKKAKSPAFLT